MRAYRYVTLDPTGNITCLVLDPAGAEEKARLTRRLLQECDLFAFPHQGSDDLLFILRPAMVSDQRRQVSGRVQDHVMHRLHVSCSLLRN